MDTKIVIILTIVTIFLGIAITIMLIKENKKYWQWMPMHKLWYKITRKRRNKKGVLKVRLYDQYSDLYQCPICKQYLGIDDMVCDNCGQRFKKHFWA